MANSPWAGRRREVPAQPSRQGARATDAGTYRFAVTNYDGVPVAWKFTATDCSEPEACAER